MTTTPAPYPGCRIGRVRFKSGAEVRVIDRGRLRPPEATQFHEALLDHAAFMVREWPKLAGYALVVWDADGAWTTAYRLGNASPIPIVAVPRFAGDCLRQDISVNAAVDWLNSQRRT